MNGTGLGVGFCFQGEEFSRGELNIVSAGGVLGFVHWALRLSRCGSFSAVEGRYDGCGCGFWSATLELAASAMIAFISTLYAVISSARI